MEPASTPLASSRQKPLTMLPSTKLSIVLPVRNGAQRIAKRVERVLADLVELAIEGTEIVIVDDGSLDATSVVLDDLCVRYSRIRVMRHSRPRGMEAAGQTGLERSTGDLVFIQEADEDLRIEDLRRLLDLSEDTSIVAARAESVCRPLSAELLRRLRAWGTNADLQVESDTEGSRRYSLQMVRRTHLHTLAGPRGHHFHLTGETTSLNTVASV